VLVAVQLWTAMSSSFTQGATAVKGAAVLCGVLAVFGLPSVPVRSLVWVSTAITMLLMARFGMAGAATGVASVWRSLLWLVVTAAALAVTAPWRPRARWSTMAPALGSLVVVLSMVAGVALLVGPRAAHLLGTGSTIGEAVDTSGNHPGNPLDSTSTLDMTTRPQLSDRVVMTVDSPVASFWRSEVFDLWDGVSWSRSAGRGGSLLTDGTVTPPPEDLSGNNGESFETEVRIEAGFATALPVAPSAVEVTADGHQLAQRTDGTVVAVGEPLGRGASYSVTSRRLPLDPDRLTELGRMHVPTGVSAQYAQQPVATQRTVDLAREIAGDLGSNYEVVLALDAWMGENTRYDINAPLSPPGVDVVDHFLFESQLGWCEQIASSLVVMARSVGIPARLATGYVPGEWDALSGRFIVRELHAHSWAEVWFPEVGWVPFDPTADVPLSGSAGADAGGGANRTADVVGGLLLVVALGLLGGPAMLRRLRAVTARLAERRRRRQLVRSRWDVAEEEAIETEGAVWLGRERAPAETLGIFAHSAIRVGAPATLVERAEAVEQYRYGPKVPVGAGSAR
jgi:transglutaminase-like putative cysteine protease